MMFELNEQIAQRVLDTVRPGLSKGIGKPNPGEMCVEAAVCYALGLPHSDDPKCVNSALRNFKITLNDSSMWSSNKARAKGLERLAIAQLGTKDTLDTLEFVKELAQLAKKWSQEAQQNVGAAAWAAEEAAEEAARVAAKEAADKILSDCAEDVVQLLIKMNAPGTKYLYLTSR